MSQPSRSPDSMSPDEALPKVEPPNAGFILQLFVVPAVIVGIIVLVWLAFNWLAHRGDDPNKYVEALSRDNAARWQAAVNLANALRTKGSKENPLRKDDILAAKLANVLKNEIETGNRKYKENDTALRAYLCRALGEFDVSTGLPVLFEAATTQREEADITVRRSALEAIALMAANPATASIAHDPKLLETLAACAHDEDAGIRSRVAFMLGVLGADAALTAEVESRLSELLHDRTADVRYNAATALARLGDAKSIPVLVEMLTPEKATEPEDEDKLGAQKFKRASILENGLKATEKLAKANQEADLEPLCAAAEKLANDAELQNKVRDYAHSVADALGQRQAATEAPAK